MQTFRKKGPHAEVVERAKVPVAMIDAPAQVQSRAAVVDR